MQNVVIKKASRKDLKAIISIEAICFPLSEAADANTLQKRFDKFMDRFVVAEIDGCVIGFINGCCSDQPKLLDVYYLDESLHMAHGAYQMVFGLAILPQYRNQGIANKLLRFFINDAKMRGCKGIILTCKENLIHFYETFGFVHQGVSKSVHGGVQWNDMVLLFEPEENGL